MYLIKALFNYQQQKLEELTYCVNQIIEQWRYNGQIIGREIPIFLAHQDEGRGLAVQVVCPEQQSLLPQFNNQAVDNALEQAESAGIFFDGFQIIAEDLNSDATYTGDMPSWQILYTTYLQSCSPLHSGEDLLPIPLYKSLQKIPHLSMDIIKWQENWQACDQLQMNASILEKQTLFEISDTRSKLFKHGYYLTQEIERYTGIPTYYYLYRVGGKSLQDEAQRHCPICQQEWRLSQPLFDLFHFKCDHCRIVSNLSWHWQ